MQLENKVFVITGAGNGMGRELSLQLIQLGAEVAGIDLRQDALEETSRLCPAPSKFSTYVMNIADRERVQLLPKEILAKHGRIDALVNCAGIIQPFVKVEDLTDEAIDHVMNVNYYGSLYMCRAFLPHLKRRPEAHLINFSSMGGFLPVPGQAIYGASKAAVKLLTEALYAELQGTSVHVSVVFPGAIATNIAQNSGVSIGLPPERASKSSFKSMPVEKAVALIIDGIRKNKMRMLIGRDAKMMDLFYRLSPKRAVHLILRQMGALLQQI
jgi:short-subunit dehydrogenase